MKCIYVKPNGKQCEAEQMKNSDFCFRHNPAQKKQQLEASRKGGEARKLLQSYGKPIQIKSAEDVVSLLGKTIEGVWEGKIPANQPANTIGFLCRCYLDAYDKVDIENRISNLESQLPNKNI